MKIGLFIVGDKGFNALKSLKRDIEFVVTYSDKGMDSESFKDIINYCSNNNIKFYNRSDYPDDIYNSVDNVFVIGWQYMLKDNLDKTIVIHDSYLPEYKGWSPTVNYLIEGSEYLAATAFRPTMKVDTGDIIYQEKINITYPLKINDALKIVSELYVNIITYICDNNPQPYPMDENESFCLWRDSEDYLIDWTESAERIKRFVDAVGYPYDGAKISINNQLFVVLDVDILKDVTIINREKHIGKIIRLESGKPVVVCGEGLIQINESYKTKFNIKTRL